MFHGAGLSNAIQRPVKSTHAIPLMHAEDAFRRMSALPKINADARTSVMRIASLAFQKCPLDTHPRFAAIIQGRQSNQRHARIMQVRVSMLLSAHVRVLCATRWAIQALAVQRAHRATVQVRVAMRSLRRDLPEIIVACYAACSRVDQSAGTRRQKRL